MISFLTSDPKDLFYFTLEFTGKYFASHSPRTSDVLSPRVSELLSVEIRAKN